MPITSITAGLMSSTTRAASALIARAGLELVAEGAHLDFEPRDVRFVQLARVNDIVVLDAAGETDSAQRMLIENALFESGRSSAASRAICSTIRPLSTSWLTNPTGLRHIKVPEPIMR